MCRAVRWAQEVVRGGTRTYGKTPTRYVLARTYHREKAAAVGKEYLVLRYIVLSWGSTQEHAHGTGLYTLCLHDLGIENPKKRRDYAKTRRPYSYASNRTI